MRSITVAVMGLILSACAADTPEPTQYLLSTPSGDSAQVYHSTMPLLVLSPIGIDSLLSQDGIVYQTSANQTIVAKQHVWAEDLATQLTNRLLNGLRSGQQHYWVVSDLPQLGRNTPTMVVNFQHFNGNYLGQAIVAGEWSLLDNSGQLLASSSFRYRQPLSVQGYPALVNALSKATDNLIQDLSSTLQTQ